METIKGILALGMIFGVLGILGGIGGLIGWSIGYVIMNSVAL